MKYFELKEGIQDIYTELSYNSRFIRIVMWHLIGKTLLENADIVVGKTAKIAVLLDTTPSNVGAAVLFAKDYPCESQELDKHFPHDKTISWSQIVETYNAKSKET